MTDIVCGKRWHKELQNKDVLLERLILKTGKTSSKNRVAVTSKSVLRNSSPRMLHGLSFRSN